MGWSWDDLTALPQDVYTDLLAYLAEEGRAIARR